MTDNGALVFNRIRSTSRSRKPRLLPWQRETLERNWRAGKPIYEDPTAKIKPKAVRTIAFASPHCLIDFTSGAAIATLQALRFLNGLGFTCQAFCGSQLDAPEEALFEELLANQKCACRQGWHGPGSGSDRESPGNPAGYSEAGIGKSRSWSARG